jgi:hypothetical protein
MNEDWGEFASKGGSDDKSDSANAEGLLQPEGISHSESVPIAHVVHNDRICRQRDHSLGHLVVWMKKRSEVKVVRSNSREY